MGRDIGSLLRWTGSLFVVCGVSLQAQRAEPAATEIHRLLTSEQAAYSLLTYTQHYIDTENGVVDYAGVLYLHLQSFAVEGCDLKIDVVVQDRFDGTEEKRVHGGMRKLSLGHRVVTYRYSYSLDLSQIAPPKFTARAGRPVELQGHTSSTCQEDKLCQVEWLSIKNAGPQIQESKSIDGADAFDQKVSEIAIPLTSEDVADHLRASLGNLAQACRKPR